MVAGSNSVVSVMMSSDCGSSVSARSDRQRSGVSDGCFNLSDAIRCSDWKGKLVEEKRRRRAAEQSLTELAGRFSRLHPAADGIPPREKVGDAAEPSAAASQPHFRSRVATPGLSTAGCSYCGGLASCAGQDVDAPAASAFSLDGPFAASNSADDDSSRLRGSGTGDAGCSIQSASLAGAAAEQQPPVDTAGSPSDQMPCQNPHCAAALAALTSSVACQLAATAAATQRIEQEAAAKFGEHRCGARLAADRQKRVVASAETLPASSYVLQGGLMAGCVALGAIAATLVLSRTRNVS